MYGSRSYTLEEWQAVLSGYSDALVFAAHLWVPGPWALIGAVALPILAAPCHYFFRSRFAPFQLLFTPLAGGFAGGYFYAVRLQGQFCEGFTGVVCVIQSPPDELANIILGIALSVVAIYLAFPGRKIPRHLNPFGSHGGGVGDL